MTFDRTLAQSASLAHGLDAGPAFNVTAAMGRSLPDRSQSAYTGGMTESADLRCGILIVSDRRSAGQPDQTGPALVRRLAELFPGARCEVVVVPDEGPAIEWQLIAWADEVHLPLVLTSGGTGFSPRDVTPEATRAVLDRPAPGLVVAMIVAGLAHTPHAMLGRPEAGIRGRTLIVNLPGSPRGAVEALDALAPALPHALALLSSDPGSEAGHRPDPARPG
jgi:molybdenum cofactor synthesis domain-containing protein